jgi:multiple sugar transport system substrate-binding protein
MGSWLDSYSRFCRRGIIESANSNLYCSRERGSKMRRRQIHFGLVLLITMTMLQLTCAAVGAEKIKLVWFDYPQYTKGHDAIAALFMAKHPNIEVEIVRGWEAKLVTHLASGLQVDIYEVNDPAQWKYRNAIMDLTDFVKKDIGSNGPLNRIPPPLFEAVTVDGQILSIPMYWWTMNTVYNLNLLQQAGIAEPSGADWTWDKYRALARQLTVDSNGDGIPDIWGTGTYSNYRIKFRHWLFGADADFYNKEMTQAAVNTPDALHAWRFMYDLEFADRSHAGWMVDATSDFKTGRVGLILGTFDYAYPNKELGLEFEIAPSPMGPKARAAGLIVASYAIHPSTKHPQEAYEFLKFIASEEAQLAGRAVDPDLAGVTPSDRKLVADMFKRTDERPFNKNIYFDALGSARSLDAAPLGVNSSAIHQVAQKWWGAIAKGEQSLLNGLDGMNVELNALIPK